MCAATAFVLLPSLVAFVALDGVWIGLVAKNFYFDRVGPGLKDDVDMLAAALSWVCIVAANQVFVLPRTRGSRSFSHIFLQVGSQHCMDSVAAEPTHTLN